MKPPNAPSATPKRKMATFRKRTNKKARPMPSSKPTTIPITIFAQSGMIGLLVAGRGASTASNTYRMIIKPNVNPSEKPMDARANLSNLFPRKSKKIPVRRKEMSKNRVFWLIICQAVPTALIVPATVEKLERPDIDFNFQASGFCSSNQPSSTKGNLEVYDSEVSS